MRDTNSNARSLMIGVVSRMQSTTSTTMPARHRSVYEILRVRHDDEAIHARSGTRTAAGFAISHLSSAMTEIYLMPDPSASPEATARSMQFWNARHVMRAFAPR
jgi:hypothetical protein